MSRFSKILIVLFVLIGGAYYWYLINTGPAGVPERKIDIARLRQAAQQLPGSKPVAIEYNAIAVWRLPGTTLVAGGGLRQDMVGAIAYRLVTPDGDIVIDSGPSDLQAAANSGTQFNPAAQAAVDDWMVNANLILFTQEQSDHMGGFLSYPAPEQVTGHALISPEMMPGVRKINSKAVARLGKPIAFKDYTAVAPGVVLLHTPGQTPGAQMIFVQLQDGREYLFTGDTASMRRNVTWNRPRSRLLTDVLLREDRAASIGWLKGLVTLHAQNPGVTLVYSHDVGWLQDPRTGPGFKTKFLYQPPKDGRDPTVDQDGKK